MDTLPEMARISILMPVWNGEATVASSSESILAQSFKGFEFVIVDDGSTDRTSEIVRELAAKDRRIKHIRTAHQGIVGALNAGLAECSCELVARMDADDLAHPDRLARQFEFLQRNPDVRVCSCLVEFFPSENMQAGMKRYEEWVNAQVMHDEIVRELFVESPLPHPSVMMYRADCRYEDRGWPEDYDLWLRCHEAGLRFGKVPDVLLSWRHTEHRLSLVDAHYSAETFLRAKAHYLARIFRPSDRRIVLWGAGKTGRRLLKGLLAEGAKIEAIIDIDPRKIGRARRGVPVVDVSWLKDHRDVFVIAAVSQLGAQALIREALAELEFREGRDFLCAA